MRLLLLFFLAVHAQFEQQLQRIEERLNMVQHGLLNLENVLVPQNAVILVHHSDCPRGWREMKEINNRFLHIGNHEPGAYSVNTTADGEQNLMSKCDQVIGVRDTGRVDICRHTDASMAVKFHSKDNTPWASLRACVKK